MISPLASLQFMLEPAPVKSPDTDVSYSPHVILWGVFYWLSGFFGPVGKGSGISLQIVTY